ncbi:FAD binding domain-containing protein [Lophiostoma macrostomum CBS 122681]|uniref:FAD binding domain-containing protein n=1 Tax=Lophiostoma macrostomum CBS 122681 TaxID=1314788 RepID=A0A6A6TMT2_9PLEO|nr:FAD binding domain-containing protein [Lophiostoma macrostomum CBS 122681]
MNLLVKVISFVIFIGAAAERIGFLADLQPLLSNRSSIYLPDSWQYLDATTRWDASTHPGLDAVVKVASETDVQRTIEYANLRNISFLAIGGAHGGSQALNRAQNAIGIWLRGLEGVSITVDGNEAVVQAGHTTGEVIRSLWSAGKMAVTGAGDCTGFISPMLGGGHGWLQGRYGLLADNLISARLILANGTAMTVDSQTPDLFWALRGAGHNFGIVTSVHYRVYDRVAGQDGDFRQDKLDAVFSIANQWIAARNRPIELSHFTNIVFNPAVDQKPVFNFIVYWQGDTIPAKYTDPFKALNAVSMIENWLSMANLSVNNAATEDGPACAKGASHRTYPLYLIKYDVENMKRAIGIFAKLPASFSSSSIMMEGLGTNRVREVADDSTAFPHRNSNILVSPLLSYAANDALLDAVAFEFGKQLRSAFLNHTEMPLGAYVNYANGDEGNGATYGYDSWRLQKLQRVKRLYDPTGKFSLFEPIEIE